MLDQFVIESEWYNVILERGELLGERRGIQRVLEGRFGTLPSDILDALKQTDEATLEAVAINAATDTLEQMRERLGIVAP